MRQVDGRKEDVLTRGGLAVEPRLSTPMMVKALNNPRIQNSREIYMIHPYNMLYYSILA
jgi:hypothetical protein